MTCCAFRLHFSREACRCQNHTRGTSLLESGKEEEINKWRATGVVTWLRCHILVHLTSLYYIQKEPTIMNYYFFEFC